MAEYKIVALFGKSGAGKDTLLKELCLKEELNLNKIIRCTTREPRENESEGNPYHFITPVAFLEEVMNFNMLEANEFNKWFYGTNIADLKKDSINIGAFDVEAVSNLMEDNRLEVIPIYIQTSDKIRLIRQLNRETNPNCTEICRRYLSDTEDYEDIDFNYLSINGDNNLDNCIQDLANIIKRI